MYRDQPAGAGRLGPLLDRCFLDVPAAAAVRNRRGILAREIRKTIEARRVEQSEVTSLACGPAQELFDVYETLESPLELKANLVDMDLQALAYVADKRDKLRLTRRMVTHNENLIFLALGRRKIELSSQDLVYSIGLIDYFDDDMVVRLLNWIHGILAPGGRVILGNFHPDNPTKALMDHVLEWRLIHRGEDDMNRLFQSSAFGRAATDILWEEQRINLFAECVKA
jgi:extracellular factor (EF) 3-hydroxypalmitic acid methyl ester biosynthesis protein